MNLKTFTQLQRYLKPQPKNYVWSKSKTFTAEQIDTVLKYCMDSEDPSDHLLGVGVALMYYSLLRISNVLKVQVKSGSINKDKNDSQVWTCKKKEEPGFHVPYTS